MTFVSSKTYGHDVGLSACFRQWRAKSHCQYLHGYALKIHLEFVAEELDHNGWVVDFGRVKTFKEQLVNLFDHKTLVAIDDPQRHKFEEMDMYGLIQMVSVARTGCEAFAHLVHDMAVEWLIDEGYYPRVRMKLVTVSEHGANSATYYAGDEPSGVEL